MRNYFLTARGWKPIVLAMLIVAALILGFLALTPDAHAYREPTTKGEFAQLFNAGLLGRAKSDTHYSKAFKRSYLKLYRKAADAHRDLGVRRSDEEQWSYFTSHDTCAGTIYTSYLCETHADFGDLLDSPYWKGRSNTQNEWTAKVVFRGGIGIATFYTGGTAAAAVGPGAAGCLGGFFMAAKWD